MRFNHAAAEGVITNKPANKPGSGTEVGLGGVTRSLKVKLSIANHVLLKEVNRSLSIPKKLKSNFVGAFVFTTIVFKYFDTPPVKPSTVIELPLLQAEVKKALLKSNNLLETLETVVGFAYQLKAV